MATYRTAYQISEYPLICSWKCSHCGTYNSQRGKFLISDLYSSSGKSKTDFINETNIKFANANHAPIIFMSMASPSNYTRFIQDNLRLNSSECKTCNKKETWSINNNISTFSSLLITALLIMIIGYFSFEILIFFILLSPFVYFLTHYAFSKIMDKYRSKPIPNESQPRFYSNSYTSKDFIIYLIKSNL